MRMVKVNVNNKSQMKQLRIMADEGKVYKNREGTLNVFGSEHFNEIVKVSKMMFIK